MWNTSGFGGNPGSPEKQGGFLNTSTFGSPSVGSQTEKKKSERLQNVVPCTIAHVLNTPETEEHVKYGSNAGHIITVIGVVKSVDEQSTRITYQLDDMTGLPVEVQLWLGDDEETTNKERSLLMENTYVRVTGSMRTVKGKRLIIAFKVKPLTDMNELTMHLLEIMHTAMAFAVMDNQPDTQSTADFPMTSDYRSMGNFGEAGGMMSGLSKPQQLVLQLISSSKREEGVGLDFLFSNIKSLNKATVREAIEFLSNEGHIYSTIDDEHYKATDG